MQRKQYFLCWAVMIALAMLLYGTAAAPLPPPSSGGGGGGGGCFIATAAFGSPLEGPVRILREFRDRYLAGCEPGRRLIQFYSEASPPVAAAIAENDALRSVTRWLLLPVIGVAYLAIHPGITTMILLMALAVWAGWSMLSTARGARSKRRHL